MGFRAAVAADSAVRCSRCATVSVLDTGYVTRHRSFRLRPHRYCPPCAARVARWAARRSWAIEGLFVAAVAGWIGDAWLAVNIVFATCCAVLCTIPHELGHALAARAVGLHVFRITIGSGRERWRGSLFGLPLHLRTLPLGGFTQVLPRQRAGARPRMLVAILAGPAVNFGLAAAAVGLFGTDAAVAGLGGGFEPVSAFCFANAWSVLVNLIPFRSRSALGTAWSDGGVLLTLPFWSRARIDGWLAGYFAAEAIACGERGDPHGARAWLERGLLRHPDSDLLGTLLGQALLERRDYAAALALYRRMLARPGLPPEVRAMLLNNIAYTHFLAADPAALEEADRYSAEAMEQMAWQPAILGTRGSVLVARGHPDDGVPLLRRALAAATDDRGKALNACALALGVLQQGDRDEACILAATVRRLDPSCALLERLASALAGAERRDETLQRRPAVA